MLSASQRFKCSLVGNPGAPFCSYSLTFFGKPPPMLDSRSRFGRLLGHALLLAHQDPVTLLGSSIVAYVFSPEQMQEINQAKNKNETKLGKNTSQHIRANIGKPWLDRSPQGALILLNVTVLGPPLMSTFAFWAAEKTGSSQPN